RQPAARFWVAISTAIRWSERAKDGEPTSRPQGWRRPSALDAHEAFVVERIEDRKDVTLDEMVERLSVERQLISSRSACGAWLRGRGWTLKKSP
ncbi:IS630 family transposase, partial [Rhizobium ruizarguesonis]